MAFFIDGPLFLGYLFSVHLLRAKGVAFEHCYQRCIDCIVLAELRDHDDVVAVSKLCHGGDHARQATRYYPNHK